MNSSQLIQDLNRRYATKVFDATKKLEKEQVDQLLESARLAPSSYGLQPWKFIVVQDQAIRSKLVEHSYGQTQVVDASHLIVLCIKKDFWVEDVERYIQDIITTREVPREKLEWYKNMMIGTIESMKTHELFARMRAQVYIALGFVMAEAAHMHIDSCPMEWISHSAYDTLLWLGEHYTTVVACPVGYRSDSDHYADLKKVRYAIDQVVERK